MIGAVLKLIIFTNMVNRIINTSRNERVTQQVYDTYLQMFDVCTLALSRSFHASFLHTRPSCTFSFTKAPSCLKLLIPASNDVARWGGSLLNCRRNAHWTETTDSCFTKCSTQNAFCSGVAIIVLFRHIVQAHKTWTPALSFHMGNLLLCAFWKS